jgi:glyoxalase family protein
VRWPRIYARVLGLRLVKKTVNFDAPDVYHLYYGDERGRPGSILTFFEFPDAAPGRAGAGMIHRLRWRVGTEDALGFWAERLARDGVEFDKDAGDQRSLAFRDPEGLGLELAVVETDDEPLTAAADGIAPEHALRGFDGVRAYSQEPERGERIRMPPSRTVAPYSPAWTPRAPGRSWVTGGIWGLSHGIRTCSSARSPRSNAAPR